MLIQGSGWGWLGYSPELKRLIISTTANQDPLSTQVLPLQHANQTQCSRFLAHCKLTYMTLLIATPFVSLLAIRCLNLMQLQDMAFIPMSRVSQQRQKHSCIHM